MPFKSQAQRRKFYAMKARGEISPKVVEEFEKATPKGKKLPERIKPKGMSKAAFIKGFRKALQEGHPVASTLTGAAAGAGILGGLSYLGGHPAILKRDPLFQRYLKKEIKKNKIPKHKVERYKKEKMSKARRNASLFNLVYGGVLGGIAGNRYAKAKQFSEFFRQRGQTGFRAQRPPSINEALNTIGIDKATTTTKHQVKKKFYQEAMKHHPDRGGSPEKMKRLNQAWEDIQDSSWFKKLSFILKQSIENGGNGLSGGRKGNKEQPVENRQGTVETVERPAFIDRDREPRDYSPWNNGPGFIADSVPIKY
jgi:hypothetical protein